MHCTCPLLAQSRHSPMSQLRSLLGVKRTWVDALHMSAFDPKRTLFIIHSLSPGSGRLSFFISDSSAVAAIQQVRKKHRLRKAKTRFCHTKLQAGLRECLDTHGGKGRVWRMFGVRRAWFSGRTT